MTLSLMLRPKRLNRLILQHSLDNSNLSLEEFFDVLIDNTILKRSGDSYLAEIQHLVNITLLNNIFKIINDTNSFSQVKSICNDKLEEVVKELSTKNNEELLFSDYYVFLIKDFYKDSKKYKIINSLKIPDGSPIGTDNCSYIHTR
tara:strand:- start:169 stop:606 length:438 start_codon:yes stop_codon:yes gene_type:complete